MAADVAAVRRLVVRLGDATGAARTGTDVQARAGGATAGKCLKKTGRDQLRQTGFRSSRPRPNLISHVPLIFDI